MIFRRSRPTWSGIWITTMGWPPWLILPLARIWGHPSTYGVATGILDHLTGRLIFITVAELAGINGFTIPGIIAALASARAARALLRRVRHDF